MKGKILAESSSVVQDQAKVLFDYYTNAAEKIVAAEEKIEKEIKSLEDDRATVEKKISGLWVWFLTIILFFMYFVKKGALTKQIAQIDERIEELKVKHRNIFRDYKVNRMGVAYVPVAEQIKYNDRSFVVDLTGKVPESEVTVQMSRQTPLLIQTINEMNKLSSEAPIVESSEDIETVETADYSTSIQEVQMHDYLGGMERALRTITFCMKDLDSSSVNLPLVGDNSRQLANLDEYATDELPANAPVINLFDASRYERSIEAFREINKLKDSISSQTEQFEEVLRKLIESLAGSIQAVSALKMASTNKMVNESNSLLYTILKAPYNHYSPMLEYEEIDRIKHEQFNYSDNIQGYEPFNLRQSSRVKLNPVTNQWVAEDGSTTTAPFGVHQIYEEIFAPMVQDLMMENRLERLKVYNHIKDQKMSYLVKWHQDTEEFYRANRAESSEIINLMSESLRGYVAAYNTLISLRRTTDSMNKSNGNLASTVVETVENTDETLAAFELQSQEFMNAQTSFEEYMDRLKEDIDERAERFGHVEYYDAKLRDGYANEAAVATSEVAQMDDRRKGLAVANPLMAKNSVLLPEPQVESLMMEHFSLNLPAIARASLTETAKEEIAKEETPAPVAPVEKETAPETPTPEAPADEETAIEATSTTEIVDDEAPAHAPSDDDESTSLAINEEDENEDKKGSDE